LESLLIQPVQRIPRYRLLFAELIKYTPKDHPDYAPSAKALRKIEEVAIYVNESVRDKENQERLALIESSFTNKGPVR
jgi:FYVE, RhoGEF and PH domain containing 3